MFSLEESSKIPQYKTQAKLPVSILENLLNLQEEIEEYISLYGEEQILLTIYDRLEEIISSNL